MALITLLPVFFLTNPGFEYDTLGAWEPSCQLPMQIAMEVHYQYLYGNEKKPKNFANL